MYDALSDIGETIKVIGDNGATIHLANVKDLHKLGKHEKAGSTRISTVANKELEETETVTVTLESDFKNKWQSNTLELAVLPSITRVNEANHTEPVEEVLKA